ncbi:mobilization protein [Nodosilinea sp. LEGE 06152]|uniref:mobilization protein n=1 Tax=Nodosilinea sp. LEGE 06152 TaxID=2777966 RepID=UPI00187ED0EA|nr:mobilization protein [Nodosilinea sp. LEGE 06152]MBE9155992.1 mobilization protein [Nodosilinea sp. LEGE 06152]
MVPRFSNSRLHFVGGRKGGVGKSFYTRLLIESLRSKGREFTIAECDRVNPDVGRIYKELEEVILAYFSEDERKRSKADALFAEAQKKTVVANLPAQVHQAMLAWFTDDALYELAEREGVSFCHWYVSNGGYDSVQLFYKTVADLGEWMPHVFVRNWGLCDDWSHVDQDPKFQALIEDHSIPVIDLPKCSYLERNFIEAHQLTLSGAESHKDLTVVSRQRIKHFLRQTFQQIEQAGML